MSEEKVQIKNNTNEILIGVETLPTELKDKNPAVILVHGFAYQKEEDGMFVELAKRLAEIGVISYRFDFSGCGESEGDYASTTLSKLRDELKLIIEFVKTRSNVDASRIGIVGQSFGTTTTIALAPEIKSLVLMGTVLNAKEILKNLFGDGYNPGGISIRVGSDANTVRIKPEFWTDFENHDLPSLLKRMKCSLLLIHGSEDDHVPLSETEETYQLANEPKEKIILEGAGHGLEPKREGMYRIVVDWFKKTLI